MGREFNQRMVLTHIPRTLSCHVIHVKKTRSERITDTVWFKHKYITQPKVTPADQIVNAIKRAFTSNTVIVATVPPLSGTECNLGFRKSI